VNTEYIKSSYCGTNACVEAARWNENPSLIVVRNSVAPKQKVFFTEDEWTAFIAGVKAGEFDI